MTVTGFLLIAIVIFLCLHQREKRITAEKELNRILKAAELLSEIWVATLKTMHPKQIQNITAELNRIIEGDKK